VQDVIIHVAVIGAKVIKRDIGFPPYRRIHRRAQFSIMVRPADVEPK
jgi:hypothetical protein